MKNLFKIVIAIVMVITIASCKKDLILEDLGDFKNEIVLNGLIYADSTGLLNVSKSIGILDSENEQVILENATVSMTDRNNSTFSFQYDSGGYYSLKEKRFVEGETYEFTVSSDGFSTVSSSLTIPYKTTLVSIDTSISFSPSPNCPSCGSNRTLKLVMNLSTSRSQKEYFIVSLYKVDTLYSGYFNEDLGTYVYEYWVGKSYIDLLTYEKSLKLVKNDYYLEEVLDDGYYYSGNELFFEKPEGVTNYDIAVYDYSFNQSGDSAIYYLMFATISEEFYKHQLSLARASYAQDDFLAEKVSVYTNVENGMGILAGANQIIKEIEFSKQ